MTKTRLSEFHVAALLALMVAVFHAASVKAQAYPTLVGSALLKLVAWPLFTRLGGPEALEQPNRRALHALIVADPGINFRELSRRSGIAAGTVRHHLTMLARAGLVVEKGFGATRRFFPVGRADGAWEHVVLMREPGLRELHGWIEAHGGAAQSAILDAMAAQGWSRSTTQHRLQRLAESGSLHVRWQGRFKRYWVSAQQPDGEPLVRSVGRPAPAFAP